MKDKGIDSFGGIDSLFGDGRALEGWQPLSGGAEARRQRVFWELRLRVESGPPRGCGPACRAWGQRTGRGPPPLTSLRCLPHRAEGTEVPWGQKEHPQGSLDFPGGSMGPGAVSPSLSLFVFLDPRPFWLQGDALLHSLRLQPRLWYVAPWWVNGALIPRGQRGSHFLRENLKG